MQKLLAAVGAAGAAVQTDTRSESLVVDDLRRVVGVVASAGGRAQHLRARRGVVLASGGFVNNPEMLRRFAPDLLRTGRVIAAEGSDDGSGIRMGMGSGGAAVRMEAACIVLSFAYGNRDHIRGILVNAQGQRYVNEDVYQSLHGEIALRRQGGLVWLVVDDSIYRPPEQDPYPDLGLRVAAVAETPEELGRELGLPEGSLAHTLAVYNAHAARGEDPCFQKERCWLRPLARPPYAAIDLRVGHGPYPVFTLGGLWTRPTGEVRDADGEVVPGLFAAGRTASGIPAQGYNSGLSLADATWSGRLAGRAAAAVQPS
jgi:3-oxo-5alpha-steroid 4-dehydrogenase